MNFIDDKKYIGFLPSNYQYEFEQERATWNETLGAQIGHYYDGLSSRIKEFVEYDYDFLDTDIKLALTMSPLGGSRQPIAFNPESPIVNYWANREANLDEELEKLQEEQRLSEYDPYEDMGNFEEHHDFLSRAKNKDHMIHLKNRLKRSAEFRRTLSQSSLFNLFTTSLFDPINLIALPFGGPTIGIAKSAIKVGSGVAVISAAQEAFRYPTDPLSDPEEVPINIGAGFLGGVVFGSLFGVLPTRRFKAQQEFENNIDNIMVNFGGMELGSYSGPNAVDRSLFKDTSTKQLVDNLNNLNAKQKVLVDEEQTLRSSIRPENGKAIIDDSNYQNLATLKNQIDELDPDIRSIKLEIGFRRADAAKEGKIDIDIQSGVVSNALLYKLFSVPMRRSILGNGTSKFKLSMLETFSDNGFVDTLAELGIAVKNSVYSRSQTRMGDYYDVLVGLQGDHVNHAGKKLDKFFHYNITDTIQRIKNRRDASIPEELLNKANTPSKLTLEEYATLVNFHRVNKTPLSELSESMAKSINRMETFFNNWKTDLQEVGLLGTKKSFLKKLASAEKELSKLDAELKINKTKLASRIGSRAGNRKLNEWISIQEARQLSLREEIRSLKFNSESAGDEILEDVFFPRYWNRDAILKNRSKLEKILEEHYTENPFIYKWNNKSKSWEQEQLSVDSNDIAGRAKKTVDDLLNQDEIPDFNNMYFGKGVSKHLKHRSLDITNDKVFEFIHTDPLKVMKAYQSRVSPVYEYTKLNNGKNFDDVVYELKDDMFKSGLSIKEIDKNMRDYIHMYDRVVGTVIRNPDRLDFKFANTIRSLAQVSYLGHAVYATVSEPAKLFHDHYWKDVFRGIATQMDAFTGDTMAKMSREEIHIAGEAIDIVLQSSHLRFMDDLKANPLNNSKWDKVKDVFFLANLLAPVTTALKQIDGIVRQHTLILYSNKLALGKATKMETTFLARYGIDLPMAIKISQTPYQKSARGLYFANTKEWENYKTFPSIMFDKTDRTGKVISSKPFEFIYSDRNQPEWPSNKTRSAFIQRQTGKIFIDQEGVYEDFTKKAWTDPKVKGVKPLPADTFKTKEEYLNFVKMHEIMHAKYPKQRSEQKINELALAELKKQVDIDREVVTTFRTAMNSGTLNTILMGTPADKPIINDGVAYIPMSVARLAGMKEDPRVKGYARIESGLMGLPFQFYSYSLAAVSKISGSFFQGQVKNRGTALLGPVMLAYIGLKLRTNEYTWDKMSYEDRFARSIDYSGLASMHSALFYESLHTSMALGGPDLSGGFLRPKYNVTEEGPAESIIGLGGAGPSYFWDMTTNGFTLATGKEIDYKNGMIQYLNGDRGAAGKQIIRNLPFAYLMYTEGIAKELGNLLDRNLD